MIPEEKHKEFQKFAMKLLKDLEHWNISQFAALVQAIEYGYLTAKKEDNND
jgi:hypothetical protein